MWPFQHPAERFRHELEQCNNLCSAVLDELHEHGASFSNREVHHLMILLEALESHLLTAERSALLSKRALKRASGESYDKRSALERSLDRDREQEHHFALLIRKTRQDIRNDPARAHRHVHHLIDLVKELHTEVLTELGQVGILHKTRDAQYQRPNV